MPFGAVLRFFRTGPDKPLIEDPAVIRRIYRRRRWLVFFSLIICYSFFYVCRLTFSVAKKPILDAGFLNADMMGSIGSALLLTYAFGKFFNGFLADRSHIGRFVPSGLLASATILLLFTSTTSYPLLLVLWGINGYFQSMGSAPCGTSLSQWFSARERGYRYGLWSTSHSIGEGLTFAVTGVIISTYGWQWGFWAAGAISVVVALVMFRTMADRPQAYGLPPISDFRDDPEPAAAPSTGSVNREQFRIFRNPFMWLLGAACASLYVSRYGINSWGVLYLQESKSYTLVAATSFLGIAKFAETFGALASGFISDFLFRARRGGVTLFYGIIQVTGMVLLLLVPSNNVASISDAPWAAGLASGPVAADVRAALAVNGAAVSADASLAEEKAPSWLVRNGGRMGLDDFRLVAEPGKPVLVQRRYNLWHLLGICLFGFGLGGLLVFLGGLIAIDISPPNARGAALGFVGLFSYLGASVQDKVSGWLIEAGKVTVDGKAVYDLTSAYVFWLCAAVLAMVIAAYICFAGTKHMARNTAAVQPMKKAMEAGK